MDATVTNEDVSVLDINNGDVSNSLEDKVISKPQEKLPSLDANLKVLHNNGNNNAVAIGLYHLGFFKCE